MKMPRATVGLRVVAGLAVIIAIGMVSMLTIYRGLSIVEKHVNRLADVEGPLAAAAYEMEVNINGIGLAVLEYLATGRSEHRAWVGEDDVDFRNYHATYSRLVASPREQALASQVAEHFGQYVDLAYKLMDQRDKQAESSRFVSQALEAMDRIVDRGTPSQDDAKGRTLSNRTGKRPTVALALAEIEAEVAEIGFWQAVYERAPDEVSRQTLGSKMSGFERALARFKAMAMSRSEHAWVDALTTSYASVAETLPTVLALANTSRGNRQTFIHLRYQMDRLLDHEIQVLLADGLDKPRREANAAAQQVTATMLYLIPMFVLAAALIGWLLVRSLLRPLRRLKRGTEAVGRGELEHETPAIGNDEFTDLAHEFNRMTGQLRETTVSRHLLASSEEKLQLTVADLRHQIAERERAERDRGRLQAKLRRTETMSAMGSLVAGVAHEVRNPLFGISSTLDAMDARLGERPEYVRYRDVLRGEVNRLGKLMGDLLDFGKPTTEPMEMGFVGDVVRQAVSSTSPLAAGRRVVIQSHVPEQDLALPMARMRLTQVFVNLIENAIQHSPQGATVRIDVCVVEAEGQSWVDCSVRDAGAGIDVDDLDKLFDPFFTRRRGGTGLGLSIVQRVVEEHAGRVFAGNHPEGGALMTVRLPLNTA